MNTWRVIYESSCGTWRITGNGWDAKIKKIRTRDDSYEVLYHVGAQELDEWMKSQDVTWRTAPGAILYLPRNHSRARSHTKFELVTTSRCGLYKLHKNARWNRVDILSNPGTPNECWTAKYIDFDKLDGWVRFKGIEWL